MGIAYLSLLDGNQQSNLEAAIVCFQSVLEVLTHEDQPVGWAITQNNLGFAYSHLVERVVQSELAHRTQDSQNRRRVLVQLTPQGEVLLQHLLGSGVLNGFATRLGYLSEEELAICVQGMRVLINTIADNPTLPSSTSHVPEKGSENLADAQEEPSPMHENGS
jgi:hypothetical protein